MKRKAKTEAVETNEEAVVEAPKADKPTRLQSAKIWHEGESFKLIFAVGKDGEKAERTLESFNSIGDLMTRLNELAKS